MRDLEKSMSPSSFGVHNTLRDTLSIKVCEEIDVVEVLEEKWTVKTKPLSCVRLRNWRTTRSSVNCAVFGLEYLLGRHLNIE